MPGAARLRHHLKHAPVAEDEVMRRDLRDRIAQPLQGLAFVRHARVMQDEHGGTPAVLALPVIGRRKYLRGDRAFGVSALMPSPDAPLGGDAFPGAALMAATRSVAIFTASGGRPRAISVRVVLGDEPAVVPLQLLVAHAPVRLEDQIGIVLALHVAGGDALEIRGPRRRRSRPHP